MDYTTSPDFVTHGSGRRMHSDAGPVDTVLSAQDINSLMWSLMQLLADAGVSAATFDPSNVATFNRVSAAVAARATGLFTGASNVLLATNGWQRLPSGLIVQWGENTSVLAVAPSSTTTPTSVTFPVAFPATCANVQLTPRNPSNDAFADSFPELVSRSTSGFVMVPQNSAGPSSTLTLNGFTWLAIGW